MKIRHYGLLANRRRREKLASCRQLLHVDDEAEIPEVDSGADDSRHQPTKQDIAAVEYAAKEGW